MKINHFVIHYIKKEQYRDPVMQLREQEPSLASAAGNLTTQGKLISNFVENASEMFDRQKSRRVYADIAKQDNPFVDVLKPFLDGELPFIDFSRRIATQLNQAMTGAPLATGGYMAVADFEASPRQLMILMIRQTEGYAIDPETLELKQSVHLDLTTINVGARLVIDAYLNDEEHSLSLVRGLKEVAKYFRTFLGVTNFKSAEDETHEFAQVLGTYFHENQDSYPDADRGEIRRNIAHHLKDHRDEPISLLAIAGLVNPNDPEHFVDYANNKGVSSEFGGDPDAVKSWFRVRYKDKRLLLDFDKTLLHDGINWDASEDELTLDVSKFPLLADKLNAADA